MREERVSSSEPADQPLPLPLHPTPRCLLQPDLPAHTEGAEGVVCLAGVEAGLAGGEAGPGGEEGGVVEPPVAGRGTPVRLAEERGGGVLEERDVGWRRLERQEGGATHSQTLPPPALPTVTAALNSQVNTPTVFNTLF